MKAPVLFFLIAAFLTFSGRKDRETGQDAPTVFCNNMERDMDIKQSAGSLFLRGDHSFSNFKLLVRKYFVPENPFGLMNTGVILYALDDLKEKGKNGDTDYTRGITLVADCLGALSLEFSYEAGERNVKIKADVSDAYGATEHLLDYSLNVNPCTAEPIASVLATLRSTFHKKQCKIPA